MTRSLLGRRKVRATTRPSRTGHPDKASRMRVTTVHKSEVVTSLPSMATTIHPGRTPSRIADDPSRTDCTITLVPGEGSSTSSIPNSLPSIGRRTVLVVIVVISFASTLPTSVYIIRGGVRIGRASKEGVSVVAQTRT